MASDLLRTETDRLEWKESASDADGILHAVCAMANDLDDSRQKGHVLVGVDQSGRPVGVGPESKHDELQQRLTSQLRSTKLMPTPAFDLRIEAFAGADVIVITVDPYMVPPAVAVNSTVWIRQGTTTRRASEADIARLQERRPENRRPFDQRPVHHASVEDLDPASLRDAFEAARIGIDDPNVFPTFEKWLTQRQLGNVIEGKWRPNPAALLVYGLNPQGFVPAARIEFVRYGGVDMDSPVASRKTITGTLPLQLEALWAQLEANLASGLADSHGTVESYRPLYPAEALKELARNLVQHRQYDGTHAPSRVEWYSDHMEFSNPGGRFGRSSEGEFGEHSDYRNPTITPLLVELGYVQQLGRGIHRVKVHLERNGNPPLRVETDGFTRLIVEARR